MIRCLFVLLCVVLVDARHFNGGTIRWIPVNPYENSSSVTISVIQSYSWSYPVMTCATNVPISTAGRGNSSSNLICVADCSTDGGYSTNPIDILTDCASVSSALGIMTSQKSKNVTLSLGAHFSLAHIGSSWVDLNQPPTSSLTWSVVFSIDLRLRSDGFINTPPVASVFSPQYAIVNKTLDIPILHSDVNTGDDIRCRWSIKTTTPLIDECAGACYPASMPSGTTLSNCTLTFRGPKAGIWYAAAIQVEDFINTASLTPLSSVPIQFLIYVTPKPACSETPVIIPLTGCLEVTVGVLNSFDIFVLNLCDPNTVGIADIVASQSSSGMLLDTLKNSPTNTSLFYKTLTWTPQANQLGPQQLCLLAYTTEFVQSAEYCVTFIVITSSQLCATSTSTSTIATAITEVETSTSASGNGPSWGLIAGISSLILPLALCSGYCLYRLLWSPTAKHRRREEDAEEEEEEGASKYSHLNSNTENVSRTTTPHTNENSQTEVPKKSYQVYNIVSKQEKENRISLALDNQGSILISIYNNTNGRRANSIRTNNAEQSLEMGNAWMEPRTSEAINSDIPISRRVTLPVSSASKVMNFKATNGSFDINHQFIDQENMRAFSTPSFATGYSSASQPQPETTSEIGQSPRFDGSSYAFKEWARMYLFGSEHNNGIPRIQRPS